MYYVEDIKYRLLYLFHILLFSVSRHKGAELQLPHPVLSNLFCDLQHLGQVLFLITDWHYSIEESSCTLSSKMNWFVKNNSAEKS